MSHSPRQRHVQQLRSVTTIPAMLMSSPAIVFSCTYPPGSSPPAFSPTLPPVIFGTFPLGQSSKRRDAFKREGERSIKVLEAQDVWRTTNYKSNKPSLDDRQQCNSGRVMRQAKGAHLGHEQENLCLCVQGHVNMLSQAPKGLDPFCEFVCVAGNLEPSASECMSVLCASES